MTHKVDSNNCTPINYHDSNLLITALFKISISNLNHFSKQRFEKGINILLLKKEYQSVNKILKELIMNTHYNNYSINNIFSSDIIVACILNFPYSLKKELVLYIIKYKSIIAELPYFFSHIVNCLIEDNQIEFGIETFFLIPLSSEAYFPKEKQFVEKICLKKENLIVFVRLIIDVFIKNEYKPEEKPVEYQVIEEKEDEYVIFNSQKTDLTKNDEFHEENSYYIIDQFISKYDEEYFNLSKAENNENEALLDISLKDDIKTVISEYYRSEHTLRMNISLNLKYKIFTTYINPLLINLVRTNYNDNTIESVGMELISVSFEYGMNLKENIVNDFIIKIIIDCKEDYKRIEIILNRMKKCLNYLLIEQIFEYFYKIGNLYMINVLIKLFFYDFLIDIRCINLSEGCLNYIVNNLIQTETK